MNPTLRGQVALSVGDVAALIGVLRTRGIPYDDRGSRGLRGYRQVYFYDPDLNLVEVNQRVGDE